MLHPSITSLLQALGGACVTRRSNSALLAQRKKFLSRRKFSVPVSQRAVEGDWALQGFSCGKMIDPPGHKWSNFTHEANELVVCVEGRMRFTFFDDQHFELRPGDELFIPAGVPHSTKNIAAENSTWLYGYDGAANAWL